MSSRRSWRSSRRRPRTRPVEPLPPRPQWGRGSPTPSTHRWLRSSGRSDIASEARNCSAPDTGNMEVLSLFGTPEQQEQWLRPLLDGEIRSGFAMTEPDVASWTPRISHCGSSATATTTSSMAASGGPPARTRAARILIVMGKTDSRRPTYQQQSMILVPARHARRDRRTRPAGLRLPRPGRPRGDRVRRRARAGREPDRRGRRRLHDRPGPARPWPHPPLHAHDRRGRAGAGADVPARSRRDVRQAGGHARTSSTGSPRHEWRSRWPGC